MTDEDRAARIGAALRCARLGAGWTQERLAEALGVDQRTVSAYEAGRAAIAAWRLAHAAELLGAPISLDTPP
jgi:transcriptional regulator with XRE-family HTH domain